MNKLRYERADYSVVVKKQGTSSKRVGRFTGPETLSRAAGKDALKELLDKLFA